MFWLELPLHPIVSSISAIAPASDRPRSGSTRVLRVLVVDDVLMNRDVAGAFLRTAGHTVTCAEGGAEAVAAVATTDFDVVLMDVRMPEMDGLEATRRIRALKGPRGRVPIVALTAQAFAEQIAECRKAGMDSHLAKPFHPDALLAAVMRATVVGSSDGDDLSAEFVPVSTGSIIVAAPPTSVIGGELPVLDLTAFGRTAAVLAPEAVATFLKTIAERAEALLGDLQAPNALISNRNKLADAAHALAGSAGMFGFERLAAVGRRFQRAVQSCEAEAPALADGLSAALETALHEIHNRTATATDH